MKNNIKKILCVVAALATVASMYGCNIRKNPSDETTTKKEGNTINYEALKTENGTAVYTYKYTDTSGNEQTEKVDIDMEEVGNIDFVESRDVTNEKFVSDIAGRGYQMSEKEAEEVASDIDRYKEFQFVEYIQNSSDKTMAYKNIKVADNGKNGIWLKTTLDAEYTIAPGAVQPVYIFGIADMEKYDEKTLKEAFESIKVELEYALINSAQDDVDWETADIKTMNIH